MTTAIAIWVLLQLLGLVVSYKLLGFPGALGIIFGGLVYHGFIKGMLV
jgi:hypothetical protein